MLCDDVIAYAKEIKGKIPLSNLYTQYAAILQNSVRFVLDRDAVMVISAIANSSKNQLLTSLPLCRLPAKEMYIEFAFQDRLKWIEETGTKATKIPEAQPPIKLGMLLFELDENNFVFHPCWNMPDGLIVISSMAAKIYTGKDIEYADNVVDELARRLTYFVSPSIKDIWNKLPKETQDYLWYLGEYDLAAEWRFCLGVLLAFNSKNIIEKTAKEDLSKINKLRAKNGKSPLLDYSTVKMHLSKILRRRTGVTPHTPSASIYAPFVIGHFKHRRTGLFWWTPHFRNKDKEQREPKIRSVSK